MLNLLPLLLSACGALLLGAGLGWMLRHRTATRKERADAEALRTAQELANRERLQRAIAEERLTRLPQLEAQLRDAEENLSARLLELGDAEKRAAELETALERDRLHASRLLEAQRQGEQQLSEHFGRLSRVALEQSMGSFLALAKAELGKLQASASGELETRSARFEELVKPFKDSMQKLDEKVHELEKVRVSAYEGLLKEVAAMKQTQDLVRIEAGNLVKALRSPNVRGLWGEMQLRRVVELAGMQKHCDFVEQDSSTRDDQRLRPDMIIKLPGQRNIVVDAKTPCAAYLEAIEAPDEESRVQRLRDHSRQVAVKIDQLAAKEYTSHVEGTLELVVLFLPAEPFLSAAFEHDPGLVERAFQKNVVLATPMTLMSLLRAISYGWKQQDIAAGAQEVAKLGTELYDRLCTMGDKFAAVGSCLGKAVKSYNDTVGSLELRVLPQARKFKELNTTQTYKELTLLEEIREEVRTLRSDELEKAVG